MRYSPKSSVWPLPTWSPLPSSMRVTRHRHLHVLHRLAILIENPACDDSERDQPEVHVAHTLAGTQRQRRGAAACAPCSVLRLCEAVPLGERSVGSRIDFLDDEVPAGVGGCAVVAPLTIVTEQSDVRFFERISGLTSSPGLRQSTYPPAWRAGGRPVALPRVAVRRATGARLPERFRRNACTLPGSSIDVRTRDRGYDSHSSRCWLTKSSSFK